MATSLTPSAAGTVPAGALEAFAGAVYAWLDGRLRGAAAAPFPTATISVALDLAEVNDEPLFELTTTLVMAWCRASDAPTGGGAAPAVAQATVLPPRRTSGSTGRALEPFAASFEALLRDWRLKLAVEADGWRGERPWAVRLGMAGQSLALELAADPAPTAYAGRPLSTVLARGSEDVRGYETGKGLTGPSTSFTFAGVELDAWLGELLAAVDALRAPPQAAAIRALDAAITDRRRPHGEELAAVRRAFAGLFAPLLTPVVAGAHPPDLAAARGVFEQELLVRLGTFYDRAAIVQLAMRASSPSTDLETSPQLLGSLAAVGPPAPEPAPAPVRLGDAVVALAGPSTAVAPPDPLSPPPTLAFLASAQPEMPPSAGSVTLDLVFSGTEIITAPAADGRRSALAFVAGGSPAPFSVSLGSVHVPFVRRAFPAPPELGWPSSRPTVADGTPGLTIAGTLSWDYSCAYVRAGAHEQDVVHLTLEFDGGEDEPEAAPPGTPGARGLIAALAQFEAVHPEVLRDLDAYVSASAPSPEATRGADVAVSTFTAMAAAVAAALGGDGGGDGGDDGGDDGGGGDGGSGGDGGGGGDGAELPAPVARTGSPERFEFSIAESSLSLPSKLDPTRRVDALLVTVEQDAVAPAATVEIDGFTAEPPPASEEGLSTRALVYVSDATGEWLASPEEAAISERTVTVRGLDVLARPSASASAWIGGNENSPAPFRYRGPETSVASPQYPENFYASPIAVASIGAQAAQTRRPEAHLEALLGGLFAAATGPQAVALDCEYRYPLADGGPLVGVPVFVLAPTAVDPASDLRVPASGCPAAPTPGPLVCMLGGALRDWWTTGRPSGSAGAFTFDLSVISGRTNRRVVRLERLELGVEWIDWSAAAGG